MLAETVIIMMMKTNRRCLCWGTGKNHRQILFFSPTGSPAGNPRGAWAGRALLGWRAVEMNNYQRVHRRGVLQDAGVLNFPWKLRGRYLVEREGEVHISNFLHINYKLGLYPSWHFFSLWVANTTLSYTGAMQANLDFLPSQHTALCSSPTKKQRKCGKPARGGKIGTQKLKVTCTWKC